MVSEVNGAHLLQQAMRLAQEQRYREAAHHAQEALRNDPDAVQAHLILGISLLADGDAAAAVDHLSRYVAKRPQDVNGQFNLAAAQQRAGDTESAILRYQELIAAHPGLAQARANLASALAAERRYGEAASVVEPGLAADRDPAAWLRWLGLLARAGDEERFRHAHSRLQEQFSDADVLAEAACHKARLENDSGDLASAIRTLQEFIGAGQSAVHDLMGALLGRAGHLGDAIVHARKAVATQPESAAYRFNLAALLSRRTDPEELVEARSLAARLVRQNPHDHASWHCLGLVQAKTDRRQDAEESLRRAVDLYPEGIRYRISLADYLVSELRIDEALIVFDRALELQPRQPEVLRQKGIALLRSGRSDAALGSLAQAERFAPRDQRTIAHLGLAKLLDNPDSGLRYLGTDRHIHQVDLQPPSPFPDIQSFNRALADDIRQHSLMRWEPVGLAARGGGLTDDLLADDTAAIRGFELRLREAVEALISHLEDDTADPFLRAIPNGAYRLNLWATLVHEGGTIDTHIHEESWLSGAYYVELPPDRSGTDGWIEFGRPHHGLPVPDERVLQLKSPREGRLFLFPSYLFHRTLPFSGSGDRISISFDLVSE